MKVVATKVKDCYVVEPQVFGDSRGFFFESFNQKKFDEATGTQFQFVQDNHSRSSQGVLRGLHYQVQKPQGKLVHVIRGEVYDVVVDLRHSSSTFGQWAGMILSEKNKTQLWVPPGFAHGFFVLSDVADFVYKTTEYYAPEFERCVLWNDLDLNIDWKLNRDPILSEKDKKGISFKQSEVYT